MYTKQERAAKSARSGRPLGERLDRVPATRRGRPTMKGPHGADTTSMKIQSLLQSPAGILERFTNGTPRFRRWVLLSCAFYYLLATIGIALTKDASPDEGLFAGITYNLAATGRLGSPTLVPWGFWHGWMREISRHAYLEVPGYSLVLAPWLKVAGCTLFTARSFSIVCGLLAILAWYRVILILTRRQDIALLSALLASVDLMTLVRCTAARPDALSLLTTLSAFLVYLTQRERSLTRALFLSNLVAAFGMIVHPNGVIGVAGIVLLFVFFDRRSFRFQSAIWFALPYAMVGCAYGLYVLQAPGVWFQQLSTNAAGRASGLWRPLAALAGEFQSRYVTSFGFSPNANAARKLLALTLVPYFVAPVACLFVGRIRRSAGVLFLLTLFGVMQFWFTFLESTKQFAYLVHVMPYYTCFVAIAALHVFRGGTRWRTALSCGLAGLIVFQAGGALVTMRQNLTTGVTKEVARHIDVGLLASRRETVLASSEFGFYFGFDHVRDDRTSRCLVTDRPLYAIIPTFAVARLDDVAAVWAPAVSATLRDCYTPPELVGTYRIYVRKESCSADQSPAERNQDGPLTDSVGRRSP